MTLFNNSQTSRIGSYMPSQVITQITVLERQFRFINSMLFTAYSTSVNQPCMKDYRAPNGLLSESELITSIKVGQLNQMVAKKRASAETSLKCRAQNNGWLMDKSSGQKFCLPVILNGPVNKGPKIYFFISLLHFKRTSIHFTGIMVQIGPICQVLAAQLLAKPPT